MKQNALYFLFMWVFIIVGLYTVVVRKPNFYKKYNIVPFWELWMVNPIIFVSALIIVIIQFKLGLIKS